MINFASCGVEHNSSTEYSALNYGGFGALCSSCFFLVKLKGVEARIWYRDVNFSFFFGLLGAHAVNNFKHVRYCWPHGWVHHKHGLERAKHKVK